MMCIECVLVHQLKWRSEVSKPVWILCGSLVKAQTCWISVSLIFLWCPFSADTASVHFENQLLFHYILLLLNVASLSQRNKSRTSGCEFLFSLSSHPGDSCVAGEKMEAIFLFVSVAALSWGSDVEYNFGFIHLATGKFRHHSSQLCQGALLKPKTFGLHIKILDQRTGATLDQFFGNETKNGSILMGPISI